MISGFFEEVFRSIPDEAGFIEVRTIGEGEAWQEWVSLQAHDLDEAMSAAVAQAPAGHDIYFGVLPRMARRGLAIDVRLVSGVLWVDIDAKRFEGRFPKLVALQRLARVQPPPNIIVDSGGGYHAYWLLTEPVPWDDAEATMRGLAKATGGDAVYDRARVLRVPGTANQKYPDKPLARVVRFDVTRYYRLDDLFDYYELPAAVGGGLIDDLPLMRPLEDRPRLPEWLEDDIHIGAPRGERSETCFKVILWLFRYGWRESEIRDIFRNWATAGIAEKYREKGRDGERWLTTTIEAARRQA